MAKEFDKDRARFILSKLDILIPYNMKMNPIIRRPRDTSWYEGDTLLRMALSDFKKLTGFYIDVKPKAPLKSPNRGRKPKDHYVLVKIDTLKRIKERNKEYNEANRDKIRQSMKRLYWKRKSNFLI